MGLPKTQMCGYIYSGDAGFQKGGSRKGSKRKAQAEILATPPQQLVIDHGENFATTTEHAHTNAASAIL